MVEHVCSVKRGAMSLSYNTSVLQIKMGKITSLSDFSDVFTFIGEGMCESCAQEIEGQ